MIHKQFQTVWGPFISFSSDVICR